MKAKTFWSQHRSPSKNKQSTSMQKEEECGTLMSALVFWNSQGA